MGLKSAKNVVGQTSRPSILSRDSIDAPGAKERRVAFRERLSNVLCQPELAAVVADIRRGHCWPKPTSGVAVKDGFQALGSKNRRFAPRKPVSAKSSASLSQRQLGTTFTGGVVDQSQRLAWLERDGARDRGDEERMVSPP